MTECKIKRIPQICAEDTNANAAYNLGRLGFTLSGNTNNDVAFNYYGFVDNPTVMATTKPSPTLYTNSSAGVQDASDVCVQETRVTNKDVTIVSWFSDIYAKLGNKVLSTVNALCSGNKPVYNTVETPGVCSPGLCGRLLTTIPPGNSIAATSTGGSGGGDTPSGCDLMIGVLTSVPSGGFGTGTVSLIKLNANGTWSRTGGSVSVVFPVI